MGDGYLYDDDWRHWAACYGEDPELWWPIGHGPVDVVRTLEAKRICGGCDARQSCLSWALEAGEDHGIWGGLTADERATIIRRKRAGAR